MYIEQLLKNATAKAVKTLFDVDIDANSVIINETRKEFEGDMTIVVFPFVRYARKSPEQTGVTIAEELQKELDWIEGFNTIKGFLNLSIKDSFWLEVLNKMLADDNYGQQPSTGEKVVLEYIGPNTNKPLHVGHIRNMLIGYAMANILEANGHEVHKVTIYNDRGIAISKSMIAWKKTADGATPEITGKKGDHFVGEYYVTYNKIFDQQVKELVAAGMNITEAKIKAPIFLEAQEMLRQWEAGDPAVRELWQTMNDWVYAGFKQTYQQMGVGYEKAYYESGSYLQGKEMVLEGLEAGIFEEKEDCSIGVDLSEYKLDYKVLLRSDGTSIYLTQDLAVAQMRYNDYKMDHSIYVVGDEQIYHFTVLKHCLKKMGKPYADGIFHLAYGMVDLPDGKMKSREGKVVDADDLILEMLETAEKHTLEQGKTEGLSPQEQHQLYRTVGLGALKYFILKVNAKKRMQFNPEESIDFLGHTGPYIQYSHARCRSVLRKYGQAVKEVGIRDEIHAITKELIIQQYRFAQAIVESAKEYDPSVIANYIYGLAKQFSKFWNALSILNNEENDEELVKLRIAVTANNADIIKRGMTMLGIEVPEQM